MKKIAILGLLFLTAFLVQFSNVHAYVSVRGYTKANGTYVAPYVRSNPNGLKYDNYSYTPNQGLYNSTYGTRGSYWDTPTYITDPDYYLGKSLYEQGITDSGSSSYISNLKATLPTKNIPYVVKNWVDNNPTISCAESTFLRAKEKVDCNTYKSEINDYTWNTTTSEFDGKHYIYNTTTQITSSCPDGYYFANGSTTSCSSEPVTQGLLQPGCTTSYGFSSTTGSSCSTGSTCGSGLRWNGTMCVN